jgi:hypothetical protein
LKSARHAGGVLCYVRAGEFAAASGFADEPASRQAEAVNPIRDFWQNKANSDGATQGAGGRVIDINKL